MSKSVFKIWDEMNQHDIAEGTATLGITGDCIAGNLKGKRGEITFAVSPEIIHEMMDNKRMFVAVLIDKDEWNKRKHELAP